ncbi:MAG: DEAD/DEAH box helicase family protein, partial [Actinomycetota bacterium]|nr:DEAD/DEAH box helicase family protein [Actinomycetota bacterium]
GVKTDYLWRRILTPAGLADIIENYAQIVTIKHPKTRKRSSAQVFPRYHQLDVVRRLLGDVAERGTGRRYLIQHSAGSGKSNSIAWLAHQLTGTEHDGKVAFDSIIVVTDRVILDAQIKDTIKSFMQVGSTVVHAERSGDLRRAIEAGKKIIITTVQKFRYILDDIGAGHRTSTFAIIIDEAHSSQGGKTAAAMATSLAAVGAAEGDETVEDTINRIVEAKKMLPNASYFAFTATPKNKTLEIFGDPYDDGGQTKHRAFHSYTMKQATQEGFILDVLLNYVPIDSYYKLVKTVEDDPEFDTKRASKKLRAYVEGNDHAVRLKAEIIVDHFHSQVLARHKIGGQARAMVVTSGIQRAIQYYHAISRYLGERKSPYRAIVAFSGEPQYGGKPVTEASLNGFPSKDITDRIQEDPYRILVCADKCQTGYDEPLLHTMYVDKTLSGVKAVQTLSRLNRAHPQKHDVAVLDFANDADAIERAFADYYRTTVLSEETDPNKLHDLQSDLAGYAVYTPEHVDRFVELYLGGVERDQLDPILDVCAAEYIENLDEEDQVDFKGKAKAFTRTYGFLATILPYPSTSWEKLSIFLNFLVPKLPAPKEDDLSAGLLETIDMESYRVEKRETMRIALTDEEGSLDPVPAAGGGHRPDPEPALLSDILRTFNDQFGNIDWTDADRVQRLITEDVPRRVAADEAYQNAQRNNDPQNARIEHDRALGRVMMDLLKDDTELFKQFSDNEGFRRWLSDAVFHSTYGKSA